MATSALTIAVMFAFAQSSSPAQNQKQDQKQNEKIVWRSWSSDVFAEAKNHNKYIILDLQAVWCHWCHVMEEKTYGDEAVIKLINSNYLAVKVDQDSRPDLANRYEDYGWPATVVFSPDGKELQKLRGYIPTKALLPILKHPEEQGDEDPNTDISVDSADIKRENDSGFLSESERAELEKRHKNGYDTKSGGWGFGHKFLYRDTLEYAIGKARLGDRVEDKRARDALTLNEQLLDPVWGGMYQYSTNNDWQHPHFEKIMEVQAGDMRIYSLAYLMWSDPKYLRVAEAIAEYLNAFLRSEVGAFYTSQDADIVQGKHSAKYFALDDSQRRRQGIPNIDRHIYSRENGWVIMALVSLYQASAKIDYCRQAEAAAKWIDENRTLPDGGFRHDSTTVGGPYLGDTLAMGRAFLALYAATGNRQWYDRAENAANFIREHFMSNQLNTTQTHSVGILTTASDTTRATIYNLDENVDCARFANLLYRYSGKQTDKELALAALRYLAIPKIALSRKNLVGGILLANDEAATDPVHITTVGKKNDIPAAQLFAASQSFPSAYKRLDWYDQAEGTLPNSEIAYPQLGEAAAFICERNTCSTPIRSAENLSASISSIAHAHANANAK